MGVKPRSPLCGRRRGAAATFHLCVQCPLLGRPLWHSLGGAGLRGLWGCLVFFGSTGGRGLRAQRYASSPSIRYQLQSDGSLIISPLRPEDAGAYSCGSHRPGHDSQKIQLRVTGLCPTPSTSTSQGLTNQRGAEGGRPDPPEKGPSSSLVTSSWRRDNTLLSPPGFAGLRPLFDCHLLKAHTCFFWPRA